MEIAFAPGFRGIIIPWITIAWERFGEIVKRGLALLALAVGAGLLIFMIDEAIVWPGIEAGSPMFAPIFGISASVVLVNAIVFVGFALVCKRGLAG